MPAINAVVRIMNRAFKFTMGSEDNATFAENISAAIRDKLQRLRTDSLSDGICEFIMIDDFYHA